MCRVATLPNIQPYAIDQTNHALTTGRHQPSLLERISDAYLGTVQDFSQYLFRKGWIVASLIVPSLFGEPCASIQSAVRRIFGWKTSWESHGFYNAADSNSLAKLRDTLKGQDPANNQTPLLLLHGVFSTPDIWLPWADTLQQAEKDKKIGQVITLQLPNNIEERMQVVYKAIDAIAEIYREVNKLPAAQVDIIGHSLGGYAGHLAAFNPDQIEIKEQTKVERRWHCIDPAQRNPKVRKVISVAAPTWLCCQGQRDETTLCEPGHAEIYPWKVFSEKNIAQSFTPAQIATIQQHHHNIYDIIATQDAISATVSPLPKEQVFHVKHGHLGATTCPKVCQLAISILCQG